MSLILRQTAAAPINGYWDGGSKTVFNWSTTGSPRSDDRGQYVRIGSWEANYWFHVAAGKTEKLTLSYAKRHIKKISKFQSTFQFINE